MVAHFEQDFLERIKALLDFSVGLPLEPIGYTPEEFNKMRAEVSPFISDLLESGKILSSMEQYNLQVSELGTIAQRFEHNVTTE